MTDRRRPLVFIVALLVAAVLLQLARERLYAQDLPAADDLLYVRSEAVIQRTALSYDAVLGDAYWIRTLQYFGRGRLHPDGSHFVLLYPLLDLTTSLDPKFIVAYRFGAIFLTEPYPDGAGRPDLAVKLLQKGIATNPSRWELFHDVGFIYYWHLHDYKNAASWFDRGAEMPGAPWWLRTYAAVMLTRGGDRQASRFMWQNILRSATNSWLKQSAERRLAQLDALDQIDQLTQIVGAFNRRSAKPAETWNDLVSAGILRGTPLDPAGTPYELIPVVGHVELSAESPLFPLPTEPLPGQPPALR